MLALSPDNGELAGLLLICDDKSGINLDLLFVTPQHQRQKLATNMLIFASNQLHAAGIKELTSCYHICNEASRQWHQAMGFIDSYDDYYLRLKYAHLRNEVIRREKLALLDGMAALIAERDDWLGRLNGYENLAG
ncbi:hypothetical protein VZ94_20975 [Methylocucumis oryzae]|uniref:N-acetyltransferase domain-containing protein n=1 Tax=Methylocucumis oryzae TaxID=1632867 RepID=A0A0F3IEV2_9GAMM|nr:hypothetical protein VZ94_20975 [Methylocucumis oryzae]